MKKYGH